MNTMIIIITSFYLYRKIRILYANNYYLEAKIFSHMILESLRIIAGLLLILFIPGYALTWAFYPEKQDITWSERISLSFVLSIAGVMLSILFIDIVLGIDTTPLNIVITIIVLTLLSLLAWRVHLSLINTKLKQKMIGLIFKSVDRLKTIKLRKHA